MDYWYKDGIIYQTHVKAFFDTNGDGVGDFQGLTRKLDYLQDLGVNILWLLPFYPSPLKDDGYDIANYTAVHPSYGTLADFKALLREAHRRGLRVVTELVVNHTSDQHAWFQKSRRARPGSPWRNYYVWSDTPERYKDARIIFKDYETSNWTWDPVAKAYYWHRFFSHQPDLNFDNPAVHDALFKAFDFWMDLGVDAFRLDAIPYLYEREGTTCENLPETHAYLKKLRAHLDEKYPGKMLLAEANQWPEDSLPYFGNGDECHMAFHFPVMPRMYMALAQEDRFPIADIMAQTPPIPESCQWAMFLRNHDELTLEMVTDEDRDYMWRTYAADRQARINLGIRRRLAPLLQNHRLRIHLMNGLLFSFPGTPIIYYGDEIGMGDNIYLGDRNGVRTPMQWSADRNAGFSRANPQRLYLPVIIDPQYHYEQVNVEVQQSNPYSLLWWMKRLIAQRKRFKAFGRGTMEFVHTENRKILAFIRRYEDETILVVANLSRLVQCFELDLSPFRGMVPVELSGATRFPEIGDRPYFLNLGPFAFYWFALERQKTEESAALEEVPLIPGKSWRELFAEKNRPALTRAVLQYIRARRWFGGKSRTINSLTLREAAGVPRLNAIIALAEVEYADGDPETYLLPLAIRAGRRTGDVLEHVPNRIAMLGREADAVLYEPIEDAAFADALLDLIAQRRQIRGPSGMVRGYTSKRFRELRGDGQKLDGHVLRGEQSNTSMVYGNRLFLKLFRRLEAGVNTDLEVIRFLSEKTAFENTPPLAGWLDLRGAHGEAMTLGILQGHVEGAQGGWQFALDSVSQYFERLLSDEAAASEMKRAPESGTLLELSARPVPDIAHDLLGTVLFDAELLGRRTAQMHAALASDPTDPAFAPERFTPHYQRSIYQQMRTQVAQILLHLRRRMPYLSADSRAEAQLLIDMEGDLHARLRRVLEKKIVADRIRVHGDYHLGQVLRTANDFVIIDFEGEPGRPLSERRIKRSALRDVAGMLRSFHYAPYAVLFGQAAGVMIRPEDLSALESARHFWHRWASAAFLRGYLAESAGASHLPRTAPELEVLLDAFMIEKAVYEIRYELNNRPDWVAIPLRGVLQLLAYGRA